MKNLSIHSIYKATEGEGQFIGHAQIFVRFQGCSVGCINCDSKETWEFTENNETLESVLEKIEDLSGAYPRRLKRVSITGGDPLHPKHTPATIALTKELKKRGYYINIEAAGTRVVDEVFDSLDFISFDFKTPSTGVRTNPKLLEKLVVQYPGKFQIKSVISDKKDFETSFDALNTLMESTQNFNIPWILTPCYEPGEKFPMDRFESVIKINEEYGGAFRVIGQQHKWIHGPDKRDV